MPVTQRRDRKQLRHSIGLLLGALRQENGQVESNPSETSPHPAKITDATLAFGTDNEHRGRWVYATDSAGAHHTRRISASTLADRSITVSKDFPSLPTSSWVYELWEADLQPGTVHEFINQAISGVTRKGSVHVVDESFHTGGQVNTFALSSTWTGVKDLSWRSAFTGRQFASLDQPVTVLSANVAASVDSADFREGTGAAKLDLQDAASSAEALVEAGSAAVDGRGYDRIEFWHKSNVPLTSSNLMLELRQGSSSQESVAVPATGQGRWRYASVQLTSPESNGALTGVRVVTGSSDAGQVTVWLDDLKLVRANSETWHRVPREFWEVSPSRREFTLTECARFPYARIRATGVRAPFFLETDSQVSEIDAQYLIHAAAAGLLRSRGDRRGSDRDGSMRQADLYEQLAQGLRLRMNTPANIRWVDG